MEPTFSEFSYGYAVTEELMNGALGKMTGRPMFPSHRDEGRAGGGYDVKMLPKVGVPLYLQFKRSDYMKRVYSNNWSLFNAPHYRMHLMSRKYSMQQELLIYLEASGNDVFYIAPAFHTDDELTEYYINKNVFSHSALFSPADIGHLPNDDRHYVAFDHNPIAWFCSNEPKRLEKVLKGEAFQNLYTSTFETKRREVNFEFFDDLIENTVNILERSEITTDLLKKTRDMKKETDSLEDKARFAAFLARAYFDVELFIVGEPRNQE